MPQKLSSKLLNINNTIKQLVNNICSRNRFGSLGIFLPTITNEECRERGMNVTDTEICTLARMGQGACGVSLSTLIF